MAHKVHPKIFRIKKIEDWNSRWFVKPRKIGDFLIEDLKIREFLREKLKLAGVGRIEIERFPGKINIIVNTSRPGLIIGRGGEGIEFLRREIEKILGKEEKREIKLEIREIKDPWLDALLCAQWIAQQIEKRIPYRRVLKQALDKIMAHKEVQGARVEVAGRLDGAEIARTEWLKQGRLPRQTLRSDIDFAHAQAYCSYGVVGVKVWIYKGEKF
jgi:small subunit ribosomal protein S3